MSQVVSAVGPLFWGTEVPLGRALDLVRACGCPSLPDFGPASPQHVSGAWAGEDGAIAFDFDDGREVTYVLDDRSTQQFAQDAGSEIADGSWPGALVPLRGTLALVADADADGPASVSWIEAAHLIQMIGKGGQPLSELISVARSMPPAGP